MKILFVSAVLPYPLYSGGQVRIYNILKLLSKKHEISLVAFTRSDAERDFVKQLSFCKRIMLFHRGKAWQAKFVLSSLMRTTPFLFETYRNSEMQQYIEKELADGSYDLIHIEPGYVWPSLPKTQIPVVVGEHNIEYQVYEEYVRRFWFVPLRPLLYFDVLKLRFWEERVWRKAHRMVAVSNQDKETIAKKIDTTRVHMVPNGVDIEYFSYHPKQTLSSPLTFLFVGSFSWLQNRDAVKYLVTKLWPMIVRRNPDSTLRLVGKNLPTILRQTLQKPGVVLVETVHDIREELHKADILLAPLRIGGGTKFKILECMASGVPIVTTPLGAEGLDVQSKKELVIAANDDEWLEGIEYIKNEKNRMSLIKSARVCIEKQYSWVTIAKILEEVWQEACGKTD